MSNDMKLIMESWRSNVLNEKIDECGEATVGQVMKAYEVLKQAKDAKARGEELTLKGVEGAGWILSLAGLVGELGIGAKLGTFAAGASGLAAGAAGAAAGIVGAAIVGAIRAKRGSKGAKERVDMILKTLCIDPKLIDILDDSVEEDFLSDPSFRARLDQVTELAKTNPNAPMPNFNEELTAYIEGTYLAKNPARQTDIEDVT